MLPWWAQEASLNNITDPKTLNRFLKPSASDKYNSIQAIVSVVMWHDYYLSKMAPTPALWALSLCTWRPVASRMPSFTAMERWEKDAISSSFQPDGQMKAEKMRRAQYWEQYQCLLVFGVFYVILYRFLTEYCNFVTTSCPGTADAN